jgi:two-component system, sporulation sensor kinase C
VGAEIRQDGTIDSSKETSPLSRVAIRVEDPISRRLLEGIVGNLGLQSVVLSQEELLSDSIFEFEMIIADEQVARDLRPLVIEQQSNGKLIKPALVAVVVAPYAAKSEDADRKAFDAILGLPEKPAIVSAQLGVALYSHRAFAQRYESALEELSLNRNIFKSVTSGISVSNAQQDDLPLAYVNPAFEVMTGYALEEVEGRNCRFLQNGDSDQPGLTLIREAIKGQRETTAVLRNYRKDGSAFWNELSLSPIRNASGEVTHFVGIQDDVTERVEFESALRESEKLAAVGRLASSIAHEINNPLEAMMNLLYLAQNNLPEIEGNADTAEYLRHLDEELQRVKLITARSLRFYKQSHGPEAVLASALLNSVLDVYAPRLLNYNVRVERRERSTEHIVCLVSEIRQVFSNLVTNAIDAMSKDGGRLLIRTHEATDWSSDRKGLVLTVADTGKGMSPETRANVWRAFYTTKGVSGTGLGLWISSEIVQRHHGHLRLRSRQGESSGTVFQLFLPYQAASGDTLTNLPEINS